MSTWYSGTGGAALVAGQLITFVHIHVHDELVGRLWPTVNAGDVTALLTALTANGMARLPDFGVAHRRGDDLLVLTRGEVTVDLCRDGSLVETLRAGPVTTWLERTIRLNEQARLIDQIRMGVITTPSGPALPLRSGVVGAGRLDSTVRRPISLTGPTSDTVHRQRGRQTQEWNEGSSGAQSEPDLRPPILLDRLPWLHDDSASAAGRVAPTGGDRVPTDTHYGDTVRSPRRRTGQVAATRCPKSHLNPPATPVCRQCQLPIDDRQEPCFIDAPQVGQLRRVDTGQSWPLAVALTVISHRPASVLEGPHGTAQVIRLDGAGEAIRETQVELRLDGWRLEALDRSGHAATFITNPQEHPVRLEPGQPTLLLPGGLLTVAGDIVFEYAVA